MDGNGWHTPAWLTGCDHWRSFSPGAVVIGGDYRGLGTVRSLGRNDIPVWVLTDDHLIAAVSRYASRSFRLKGTDDAGQVDYLCDLNLRHQLLGWALFPTSDQSAVMLARHHAELSERFRLTVPPWEILRWAHDKRLMHDLATRLGVDCPWTRNPANREEVADLDCNFPVVLKPAFKSSANRFTDAKAWRLEDRKSLLTAYDEACRMVDPSVIMVQELIPGSGEEQFSFAALCIEGRPLASLVARRTRQFPVDFGRSSSYVETVELPQIEITSRLVLQAMRFTGLVEVEFKRDSRDGRYKLLDVNPRMWGWHTLGRRAGVDFPYLLWQFMHREPAREMRGRAGVRWMRMATDLPAALVEMQRGHLSPYAYLESLRGPVESAIFATDDPLPALLEVPLFAYQALRRCAARTGMILDGHVSDAIP
ncbi:MAG TPA: ATP-grasp domain-containing protein [Terriglobia bacterium]|nr:ATP-grasp domain-containing protein [Terriglobia bacterium]